MRPGSFRWWFENRSTGELTIAQFPNWPLWAIGACWLARAVATDGSNAHDVLGWVMRALWLVWGAAELTQGVNPWRRLLGVGVIAWQVVAVVSNMT